MCACGVNTGNKHKAGDEFMTMEINDRMKLIGEINNENDTLLINAAAVDKRVNELLLLSRDVENLGASVELSNTYFSELANQYNIPSSEFKKVDTRLHANDIGSLIRQNEMVLFNQVILRSGNAAFMLRTAH